jgi:hypothetical protein
VRHPDQSSAVIRPLRISVPAAGDLRQPPGGGGGADPLERGRQVQRRIVGEVLGADDADPEQDHPRVVVLPEPGPCGPFSAWCRASPIDPSDALFRAGAAASASATSTSRE